jgi:Mrp family chromosome partitioning ATPase
MSADVLLTPTIAGERAQSEDRCAVASARWNPESFAQEQIRGLVRQVFFSNSERHVRQVVFSPLEAETDVRSICRRVGDALALEAVGSVAVVGEYPRALSDAESYRADVADWATSEGSKPLRLAATRMRGNLWLVPTPGRDGDRGTTAMLNSFLGEIRTEFEYSIVEGPPATESNEATAVAQFADGIILVLSAHRTRRIMARRIKEALEVARVRILGTVLSDRVFPIPEGIYRRL